MEAAHDHMVIFDQGGLMALRKKKTLALNNRLLEFLFNPKALPFTLTFTTLAVLFVGFRMKGIEQAYELNNIKTEIQKTNIRNKELKAQRAREMSVQKLREFAAKYSLKEPGPEQIILIP
jgi:cell division protein FtsL